MTAARPCLYSIAPGIPFVDALAEGLLARIGAEAPDDPLALARATVLLPTRRAARSLREAFLRASGGRGLVLPRLVPLGDVGDDEEEPAAGPGGAEAAALPPVIGPLRRQLLLARLVLRFGDARWQEADAGQAAELAAELARLLDQMETERLDFAALEVLTPEEKPLADHWMAVLDFLKIVSLHWPRVLEDEGAIGPAARRDHVLAARAAAWAARPPPGWVVAAGSTGSIPATADLLATVARLPRGCVVLPGLDRDMAEAEWAALPETHAQSGLARLLAHLGAGRDEVADWGVDWPSREAGAPARARARLASAAFGAAPAAPGDGVEAALAGVTWIESPAPAEEAAAIALIMREALEHPGRSAALVTPDRGLARRVAARLRRWGVSVDDSAGTPLAATPAAAYLRLVAAMAASGFAAVPLLACLKHPLAAGGMARAAHLAHTRDLDRLALRGPAAAPGLDALRARIMMKREEALAFGREDDARRLQALLPWIAGWETRLAPFTELMAAGSQAPGDLLRAHVAAAEALAAEDGTPGPARLWRGEEAEAVAAFVADFIEAARDFPALPGARYPGLFDALLSGRVVRPRFGRHPRLHIWGPLEARLQHADVMILGGLNEGTWPPDPGNDPWMSRPMRARLGLPLPERRIGLAAHDFAQAFAAPEVVLTRSHRVGGAPTVPSRWLARLANALGEDRTRALKAKGAAWLARAALIERCRPREDIPRPAPVPPLALRPRRLSVTEIATLQVNPYAVHARHVLKLAPLEAIAADAGAAERGSFIHEVMEKLFTRYPKGVPPGGAAEIEAALLEIGRGVLAPLGIPPALRALWWPRFCDIARWVARQEASRRAEARPLAAECKGALKFELAGGDFYLSGRADRLDRLKDGRLAVVDYKTGALPEPKDQRDGFAPQLPLLAAMAEAGVFPGAGAAEVGEMAYWQLTGGAAGGRVSPFRLREGESMADAIDEARRGLIALIGAFDRQGTPYAAYTAPSRGPRFDDYAHLARVQEWSVEAGGPGGEEEA